MRKNGTHADKNFEERLRETMGSELNPEFVSPMTAGVEETPDRAGKFKLMGQFRQTNMHTPKGGNRRSTSGRGKDQD